MFTKIIEFLAFLVISLISFSGYGGIFLAMTLESALIPLPSEIIMPFAGFLVLSGKLNFYLVILAGTFGNLLGSLFAYWLGKKGGYPFLEKYGKYFLVHHQDLKKMHRWFNQRGELTVLITRILPVVRTFSSFPAGVAEMDVKKFSLYTFLGSLPWAVLLTFLGIKMGENWEGILKYFHKFDLLVGLVLALGIAWYVKRHLNQKTADR